MDDLKAYDVWIRRVAPDLRYDFLVAKGKRRSLEFRAMLVRDETNLRPCTYFIVDHDYDGVGDADAAPDVFVLPAHSIENVLTTRDVISALLTTEFRLLADVKRKQDLLELYGNAQSAFAGLLVDVCTVLHASRRTQVGAVTIEENALVAIGVQPHEVKVVDGATLVGLIRTEQALSEEAKEEAKRFFDGCDATKWVRGKYMFQFFRAWCSALMSDRQSSAPRWFERAEGGHHLSGEWCEPAALASRSSLPKGFEQFVSQAISDCDRQCQRSAQSGSQELLV